MSKDATLLEMRTELKQALATGEYQTLISVLFDKIGYVIRKLTRNSKPIPHWYSAAVFGLVQFLISCLLILLLGETDVFRTAAWSVILAVLLWGLVLAGMFVINRRYRSIFSILHDYVLDAIESVADLADIQHWLATVGNPRKLLLVTIAYTVVMVPYGTAALSSLSGVFIGLGAAYGFLIVNFLIGIWFFYLLLLVSFHARLHQYRLKLYTADPSSSEIINQLSSMLTSNEYLLAVLMALFTLMYAATGALAPFDIIVLLVGWAPIIGMFILHHYAVARIITTVKWQTLNGIQAKIERLQVQEDIPTKETLEHISKLMDYHDRIKATRNSALDLRSGLNFLNSLLLPLLAFVLANLDKILVLFQ